MTAQATGAELSGPLAATAGEVRQIHARRAHASWGPGRPRARGCFRRSLTIFVSFLPPRSACRVRPPRCVRAPWPPPFARDAPFLAAAVAALGRWPERKKRRKRGAPPGPCRNQRPGPATAPAPPPSPERTRPAWTGMGVRAAPSCAAAPAAAGAEQRRRPGLWPPSPPPLLLLLLLSLGLLHAGRCRPGGERAARALFWVPGTPRPWRASTAFPGVGSCPTASGLRQRQPLSGSQRAGAACGTNAPGLYCSPRGCLLEPAADRVSAALTACERRTEPCAALLCCCGWWRGWESHPVQRFFFHPSLGWIPKELKLSGISFCFAKAALGTEFGRLKGCFEASLVFSVPSGLDRCVLACGGPQGLCRRRSTEECALRVINLNLNLVICDACFCFLYK